MPRTVLICASLLLASCASPARPVPQVSPASAYRENCVYFESRDVGVFNATRLRGFTLNRFDGESTPLPGVQVAARSIATREVRFAFSSESGAFDVPSLPAGEYDIWTCLDGFDELRFRLVITPTSRFHGLQVFVGLSEGPGERNVVPVGAGHSSEVRRP